MPSSLLIKKVSNVSFCKLLKILLFKIQHQILILIEKHRIKYLSDNIYFAYTSKFNSNFLNLELFDAYYKFCNKNIDIVNVANEILDNKIELFGEKYIINEADWLKDPISNKMWDSETFFINSKIYEKDCGEVKYVMELNKMGFLVYLAHAYYLSQDEKYIKKINEYLVGWIKTVKYEKSVVNKSMLDVSFRCINLIQISLLCYKDKYFRDKMFPIIIGVLIASEEQIRKFSTPRWTKFSTGANHTIGEMVVLIVTQLWLERFTNINYKKYHRKQFYYLNRSLNNIITSNGVYLEQSSHYAKLVAEFLVMLDITIGAIGNKTQVELNQKELLIKLLQYINTISYNETLPNFGDNDGAKVLYPFYKDNYSVSHLQEYLKYLNPDVTNEKVLKCPLSGQFAWQSNDSKNVFVFTRSGKHSFLPVGSGSHAHNDILSILFSVGGKPLFIDHGTYFYNSGIDILNNDRKTANHNTISFGNIEQASLAGKWMYGSYPHSSILDVSVSTDNTKFFLKGMCSYSGRAHTRTIKYEPSKLVINDFVKCEYDDEVAINFLLSPEIFAIKETDTSFSLYFDNVKIAKMDFSPSITIGIKESTYHPSYGVSKQTKCLNGVSSINGDQEITTLIHLF